AGGRARLVLLRYPSNGAIIGFALEVYRTSPPFGLTKCSTRLPHRLNARNTKPHNRQRKQPMTPETMFGPNTTIEKRSEFAQLALQGIQHRRRLSPGSPRPGERPVATVIVGPELPIDEVVCLVTEPEAAVVPLRRAKTEWNLLLWSYYEVWEAELPAHPA